MPKKGKKGAEQRTKGNVKVSLRPIQSLDPLSFTLCVCVCIITQTASSGRMAELMGGDQGFIGFEVVSSDTNGTFSRVL